MSNNAFPNIEEILCGPEKNLIKKLRGYDYIMKAGGLAQNGVDFIRAAGNVSHNA